MAYQYLCIIILLLTSLWLVYGYRALSLPLYKLFVGKDISWDIQEDAVSRRTYTDFGWAYLHVLNSMFDFQHFG